MRTSASQFQLLVDFMERYGDLSKPTEGPQGRATNVQRWADLTQLLNGDAMGDTKTAEKWRKVWSDLKNNSKKKAARIHRAAQGTGGGPASNLRLSDLEQRVLAIVGTQAATGIVTIPEVGLEEEVTEPPLENNQSLSNILEQIQEEYTGTTVEDWNRETGLTGSDAPPLAARSPLPSASARPRSPLPSTSARPRSPIPSTSARPRSPSTSARPRSPSTSAPQHNTDPTPLPLTPRRRRRGRMQDPYSPAQRRTRTQTQSDLARQAFVRSDCEWRAFQQEAERERNRLRQEELRLQERWLDLFGQFVLLGNRVVDILDRNTSNR